jgi:hypothetical protein
VRRVHLLLVARERVVATMNVPEGASQSGAQHLHETYKKGTRSLQAMSLKFGPETSALLFILHDQSINRNLVPVAHSLVVVCVKFVAY